MVSGVVKATSLNARHQHHAGQGYTATCGRRTVSARQRTTDKSTLVLRGSQILATSLTMVIVTELLLTDGQS